MNDENVQSTEMVQDSGEFKTSSFQQHLEMPRLEPYRVKHIRIDSADYGCQLSIGCQTFCLESPEKALRIVTLYLSNPEQVERDYLAGKIKISEL